MNDALERIREYFDPRQDASCEPGDDRYRGNEAMDRLADVEEVARLFSEEQRNAELAVKVLMDDAERDARVIREYRDHIDKQIAGHQHTARELHDYREYAGLLKENLEILHEGIRHADQLGEPAIMVAEYIKSPRFKIIDKLLESDASATPQMRAAPMTEEDRIAGRHANLEGDR